MFQKELAQRVMAAPGSKAYGRLAVMAGYCATVDVLAEVGAARFYPKPKVDSLVLNIAFGKQTAPPAVDLDQVFNLVGIVIEQDNPQAIIEDLESGETVFMTTGDKLGEATLKRILEDRVIFQSRGQEVELLP